MDLREKLEWRQVQFQLWKLSLYSIIHYPRNETITKPNLWSGAYLFTLNKFSLDFKEADYTAKGDLKQLLLP